MDDYVHKNTRNAEVDRYFQMRFLVRIGRFKGAKSVYQNPASTRVNSYAVCASTSTLVLCVSCHVSWCSLRSRFDIIALRTFRTLASALNTVRASEQATWDECRLALEKQLVQASSRVRLLPDMNRPRHTCSG